MQKVGINWARVLSPEDVDARLRNYILHEAFLKLTAVHTDKKTAKSTITISK